MWEKSKRVLVSSVLSLSLIGNTTVLATVNNPTQIQENENIARNYLKVSYESKILFHEQVPSKTMIQVLNENNDVVESMVLTSDKEMNLEKPKISNGKMLSYWTIEMKDGKLFIKPVLTAKEEFSVKFYVKDVGGNLLENHKRIKEVVKSATKDAKLKDVLPDVNPDNNYKFTGWFAMVDKGDGKKVEEKLQNIEDIKVTDSKGEYYAKFFSDFNNNGIDDKTEEITVNFVTNIEEQIEPVKLNVGQKIKIPKLSNKDKIFIGWYTNAELTNKFGNDNLKDSITLYAKWENAEKVITESEKKPITDKDVSDQVEKILNERFKELKEGQTNTEKPNETKTEVPNKETTGTTEKPKDNNSDNKGEFPTHVRFLLDEFANIGQIPNFEKLISTIRSRNISATIILQAFSQLKTIYKDKADTIVGNCDTSVFLGGKEKTTIKSLSEELGKETIDDSNESKTRSNNNSFGQAYSKLGRSLMTQDELLVMERDECIVQIIGKRPFKDKKYDLTTHPRYKFHSKGRKYWFDIEKYLEALKTPKNQQKRNTMNKQEKQREEFKLILTTVNGSREIT